MRFKQVWNVYLRWIERFGVDRNWSLQRELSVRTNGQTGMYEWSNSELEAKLDKLEALWGESKDVGTRIRLQNLKFITKFPRSSRNALKGTKYRKSNANSPRENGIRWLFRHEPAWLLYALFLTSTSAAAVVLWAQYRSYYFVEWTLLVLAIYTSIFFWISTRRIGWSLAKDGNTLTYQKFNLWSNWKARRQGEVVLNSSQVKQIQFKTFYLVVVMNKRKKHITFSTLGMSQARKAILKERLVQWT